MVPVFGQIAAQTPGAVFRKVDVDKNEQVAQSCGITAVPTFQVRVCSLTPEYDPVSQIQRARFC